MAGSKREATKVDECTSVDEAGMTTRSAKLIAVADKTAATALKASKSCNVEGIEEGPVASDSQ